MHFFQGAADPGFPPDPPHGHPSRSKPCTIRSFGECGFLAWTVFLVIVPGHMTAAAIYASMHITLPYGYGPTCRVPISGPSMGRVSVSVGCRCGCLWIGARYVGCPYRTLYPYPAPWPYRYPLCWPYAPMPWPYMLAYQYPRAWWFLWITHTRPCYGS